MHDSKPIHRLAYAAAHVILRPEYAQSTHSLDAPGDPESIERGIDWEATLELRRGLSALNFGIAEAMDTAQRFAIGWQSASRLIRDCGALNLSRGFVAGAGTDSLTSAAPDPDDIVAAVCGQAKFIQQHGGIPILLPIPALSLRDATEEDYLRTYSRIIDGCDGPLFVHWLGAMFLPALEGYFPGESFARVMAHDPKKVRGCKLSLLDAAFEQQVRSRIAEQNQIVLTGDDFNFASLIGGEGTPTGSTQIGDLTVATGDFSHALLGVLDGIAAPAATALNDLAQGDRAGYDRRMLPCELYGQHVFASPTQHYKVGLALTSYLAGRQGNWMLVNREDRARDDAHLRRCVELAVDCGAVQPDHPRVQEALDLSHPLTATAMLV